VKGHEDLTFQKNEAFFRLITLLITQMKDRESITEHVTCVVLMEEIVMKMANGIISIV